MDNRDTKTHVCMLNGLTVLCSLDCNTVINENCPIWNKEQASDYAYNTVAESFMLAV